MHYRKLILRIRHIILFSTFGWKLDSLSKNTSMGFKKLKKLTRRTFGEYWISAICSIKRPCCATPKLKTQLRESNRVTPRIRSLQRRKCAWRNYRFFFQINQRSQSKKKTRHGESLIRQHYMQKAIRTEEHTIPSKYTICYKTAASGMRCLEHPRALNRVSHEQ